GLEPGAGREFAAAEVFVDLDLALVELADKQVLFTVAVDVEITGGSIAGAFDADGRAVRDEPHRAFEFLGAADADGAQLQQGWEQEWFHGRALLGLAKGELGRPRERGHPRMEIGPSGHSVQQPAKLFRVRSTVFRLPVRRGPEPADRDAGPVATGTRRR